MRSDGNVVDVTGTVKFGGTLKLNAKKTKVMHTNGNENQAQQSIQIEKTDV